MVPWLKYTLAGSSPTKPRVVRVWGLGMWVEGLGWWRTGNGVGMWIGGMWVGGGEEVDRGKWMWVCSSLAGCSTSNQVWRWDGLGMCTWECVAGVDHTNNFSRIFIIWFRVSLQHHPTRGSETSLPFSLCLVLPLFCCSLSPPPLHSEHQVGDLVCPGKHWLAVGVLWSQPRLQTLAHLKVNLKNIDTIFSLGNNVESWNIFTTNPLWYLIASFGHSHLRLWLCAVWQTTSYVWPSLIPRPCGLGMKLMFAVVQSKQEVSITWKCEYSKTCVWQQCRKPVNACYLCKNSCVQTGASL